MKKGLIYLGLFFWLLFFENLADAKPFHVDSTKSNSLLNDIKPISETSNLNKNRITNHLSIGIMKGFLMPHHEDMQQMYAHIQGLQPVSCTHLTLPTN
jgi:hypothetical protein